MSPAALHIMAAPLAETAALTALARRVLPGCVGLGTADPTDPARALWPEEALAIRRAVPLRAAEFAAGRRAARAALAALGHAPAAIPRAPDRSPVWPAGLTGSITHTRHAALAATARTADVLALGIDLEELAPLPPGLLEAVTTPAERAALAGWPDRDLMGRMIFSAKEAAYKAQHVLTKTLLGFADMEVTLDLEAGRFTARLTRDTAPFAAGHDFHGRLATDARRILTALTLTAAGTDPAHPPSQAAAPARGPET
ncbi:4'-phosphopantetheinyl transferase family protein [Mesobacterium pallidum]|uniref:4'-phosphopantetheinyl transferase family protein n=1 Tax=Mesobacterium pallidum TaxID=2872037 RepID=UPI001EE2ED2D|nr:4'-phosphopantetheinyl transferase superfamily protein [Mesobacterium pallidum]